MPRPCVRRSATDVAAMLRRPLRPLACLGLCMTLMELNEEDKRMKVGRDKIEQQGVQPSA